MIPSRRPEVLVLSNGIEAVRGETKICLNHPWDLWLIELLGREPQTFEEVERAFNVFPKFRAAVNEELKQWVLEFKEGTPERILFERTFFGTNGIKRGVERISRALDLSIVVASVRELQ